MLRLITLWNCKQKIIKEEWLRVFWITSIMVNLIYLCLIHNLSKCKKSQCESKPQKALSGKLKLATKITMLWHHNARVNSQQRWKQKRFRICFHLWCELTNTMNVTERRVSLNSCKHWFPKMKFAQTFSWSSWQ